MIDFLKRCDRYANGKLSEKQIEQLWAEAIADGHKYNLLMMYLLLYSYFKTGSE